MVWVHTTPKPEMLVFMLILVLLRNALARATYFFEKNALKHSRSRSKFKNANHSTTVQNTTGGPLYFQRGMLGIAEKFEREWRTATCTPAAPNNYSDEASSCCFVSIRARCTQYPWRDLWRSMLSNISTWPGTAQRRGDVACMA